MNLIQKIEEQIAVRFMGKINVLDAKDSRFLGSVTLDDGFVVDACYRSLTSEKALMHLIVTDARSEEQFKLISEPEIVPAENRNTIINFSNIKKRCHSIIRDNSNIERLRPPQDINLKVNADAIPEGKDINWQEFKTLCSVSNYSSVQQIYAQTDIHDHEVTSALVSLKKKNIIKVVGATI